ncbi:GPALPP motifs-containing protein 1 isoform X2 [Aricia agestis]|uniref:GPALPP motifs-containing protein 1 isoform X2 n=1 Tax=Aricia agestis TaxID=91739 RepID=UPI001C20575F|nr:GPALPP motifs-containing protein 1 isoform X2 [Aricia agestis]
MLSDESSSDSETGRFKSTTKSRNDSANTSRREDSSKFSRRPRPSDDRSYRDLSRRNEDRDKFSRRSRERDRSRYSRYSPVRRRSPDRQRHRRSAERHRYSRTSREKSKPREHRSSSKDKRSRSQKSPVKNRNIKDEIKEIITSREKSVEKVERKKSSSPDNTPKMSVVLKPNKPEKQKQKSESPILVEEHESDNQEVVQPGSYYSMIPAVVKEKSEESSEIDSSDDEKLRAKLLNLEKQLQKTKKKKHKRKHKKKSSKERSDNSVEVSSTTDIHQAKMDNTVSSTGTPEVTSTQKSNQKDSSEEGEISSDDSQSRLDIDPDDLRHKLKRSKATEDNVQSKLDVCGPALPPHLEKRFKKSPSPSSKSSQAHTPPARSNIGPSIPDDIRKVLAEKSNDVVYASSEDEGIGPLPAGLEEKWSEAHQLLEQRAVELKIKKLDGSSVNSSNVKSREQWMLELPEGKAKFIGLEARTFRAKEGPDMSDRSAWTDTPEEKARKAAGVAKEEDSSTALQREARERHIASRDEEQEKAVRKHKKKHKREESLLEIHQKKIKKKKKEKDDDKKERRPFSRDIDLQVNRFDEAQKKSIIKKAQGLNTRFSSGEAKYL